jgi:UDP-GlcNAc:undecaprenyl-phosphate/decaprenyl-phosphate GlcNAc-1-phosphate transferase
MIALPFAVSLAASAALAPPVLDALRRAGGMAANYRGRRLPCPTGVLVPVGAASALVVLGLVDPPALIGSASRGTLELLAFVAGVAALGLLDDLGGRGKRAPRSVRAHLARTIRGRPSTGAVKVVGTAALAMWVTAAPGSPVRAGSPAATLAAVATLTLVSHLFNLLDLRPGRALKALALLGAGLTFATRDLEPLSRLGLVLGPLVVLLPVDLRERGMLGDTGASAAGAVGGLWTVLALPPLGQAIAVAITVAIAVYGELRSITALVERSPLLRQLDSLGRCR